jgi:adenylate cyclase
MQPLPLEEFAELVRVSADEIERHRAAGLLDPDGDGLFNGQDVLRIQIVRAEGGDVDGMRERLAASDDPVNRALFQPKTSIDDIAERTGLSAGTLADFRTAFGFSMDDVDEDDIEALGLPRTLMTAGLPPEAVLEGARVYGDALRRIAEAGMHICHRYLCEPMARSGSSQEEIVAQMGAVWAELAQVSLDTVRHLYMDFLIDAAAEHAVAHLRGSEAEDAPPGSLVATILFADVALFSTIADLEGDEAAVLVLDRADRAVRELRSRHGGKLVKQIGDEFMLTFADPKGAIRFACELSARIAGTERDAAVRIGMHTGTVLYRMGDYYGKAVNVAARIASMAMPNAILVTEPVAKAAADEGMTVEELGVRDLRGMDAPISLYRVIPSS